MALKFLVLHKKITPISIKAFEKNWKKPLSGDVRCRGFSRYLKTRTAGDMRFFAKNHK
jgi:hypothetical protein